MRWLLVAVAWMMLVGCATAPPVQRWDSVNQRVVTEPSVEDQAFDWAAILMAVIP